MTVSGSDRVVPRAESSRARFTYSAWASGSTGTRRLAVGGTLIGVRVMVSNGDWSGVDVVMLDRFRNWFDDFDVCVRSAGEELRVRM